MHLGYAAFLDRRSARSLVAALLLLGSLVAAPALAQRTAPPTTTSPPRVAWAGTPTHRADAAVVRALRRSFRRALLRHDEAHLELELYFGGTEDEPDIRPVDIQARSGPSGVAAVALFRVGVPGVMIGEGERRRVDQPCPDLWVARLSVPTGSREATIDSASVIYSDVCFSEYNTAEDTYTSLTVAVDPEARGLEGPYRVHVTGAPVFHSQQCGCGGVVAAFQAFLRVDGGPPLVVTTHEEQATCVPTLDAWIGFADHDHDGRRDLIVRQRWATASNHGDHLCETSERVATRAAVEASLSDWDHGACVRYVERTVRLWDPATRQYGPPQPLPLGNEAEPALAPPRHRRESPDGGVDAGVDAGPRARPQEVSTSRNVSP